MVKPQLPVSVATMALRLQEKVQIIHLLAIIAIFAITLPIGWMCNGTTILLRAVMIPVAIMLHPAILINHQIIRSRLSFVKPATRAVIIIPGYHLLRRHSRMIKPMTAAQIVTTAPLQLVDPQPIHQPLRIARDAIPPKRGIH
jgi:hypothetical protein